MSILVPGRVLVGKNKNILSVVPALLSGQFLLSAAVLTVVAIGLRPAVKALAEHYRKEPINIRKPLKEFDISRLPSFKSGWGNSSIPPDDIETDEYVIIRFTREDLSKEPKEVVLFVTYYSDPLSKVPHTPDVCYRQGGATVREMKNIIVDIPSLPECPKVEVRLLLLQQQTYNQALIFSFYTDGEFKHNREQVRWMIGKPGNRHVYFSKIETVSSYPLDGDPGPAIDLCKKLFCETASVLVSEHFPTKEQLKQP